jgi:transposase
MPPTAKPCVVTLDNAPWHTSRAFLGRVDGWATCGVVVHYLPPYCPELNPIEILWRKIKHDWLPLSCYTCCANLKTAVLEILGDFGYKYQISFV